MLTAQEVQEALDSTPELQTAIVTHLGTKGLVIKPTADYQNELTSATTKAAQEAADVRTREVHAQWETNFETVTGLKKPEGTKGLDWMATTVKSLAEAEKKLKEASATPSSDPIKEQVITDLRKEIKEINDRLAREKTEGFQKTVKSTIAEAFANMKFAIPGHLSTDEQKQEYIDHTRGSQIADFQSQYTPEKTADGDIVFKDRDGNLLIDAQKGGKPLTVSEIYSKKFGFMLAIEGHKQQGAGSNLNRAVNTSGDYLGATLTEIDENFEAKIKALGITKESAEARKIYQKARKLANID